MKPLVQILALCLCLSASGQIILTNLYLNPGWLHGVVFQTVHGQDKNHVYEFEETTNLLSPWTEAGPPFAGGDVDQTFFFITPSNTPMLFYRLVTLCQITPQTNSLPGTTTNVVTCTTNIVCFTNCVSCFTTTNLMPP